MEQSASVTYPNVLILDYLKRTRKANPEVQMKAEQYINLGYQRLITFEVAGGGFDWFGSPEAKTVLTAYGLSLLVDLSRVSSVDAALINRTRNLLVARQKPNGTWDPDGLLHEVVPSGDDLRTTVTAYVAWSLARAGGSPEATRRALVWLEDRVTPGSDAYTLALTANAFAAAQPKSPITRRLLDLLETRKQVEKEAAFWSTGQQTITRGGGNIATVETTALAALAFLTADYRTDTASAALTYLLRNRYPHGAWGSTQATVLSLQALAAASEGVVIRGSGTVEIQVNGRPAAVLQITEQNADVLQEVDLSRELAAGANRVVLTQRGQLRPTFQLVKRSYVPWARADGPGEPSVDLSVTYDRTQLRQNETVTANVRVRSNSNELLEMLIVDVGLAPGFVPEQESLAALISAGRIERYEVTPRQLILYLRELQPEQEVRLQIRMRARFPVRAKTPPSALYEYYNPTNRSRTRPVVVGVRA